MPAFFLMLLLLAGCATSSHFENYPSSSGSNAERRSIDVSHPDRPVILIAISGGGSRAADLGWVILKDLRELSYTSNGQSRRLIDDVAVVSSVSGGSVIAAYFGLYGPDGLDHFADDFLAADNMRTLGIDADSPLTWLRVAVAGPYDIDVMEQLFDKQLFHNKTFSELNQAGKPFVILNATDMGGGEVFAFTPSRFDDVCSDFDKEPISVGVTASAAFPILFSPVAFQNYSATDCPSRPTPQWITTELTGNSEPYINLEQYKKARYANDLRYGGDRFRDIQYLHFSDGGLADNLGVHSLMDAIFSPSNIPTYLLTDINDGYIKKIVVIIINARSDPSSPIYQSPSPAGLIDTIEGVTAIPIDAATASANSQAETLLAELKQAAAAAPVDAEFGGLKVYDVEIDFDQLRSTDEQQKMLRDNAKTIPTSLTISKENQRVIEQAGQILLRQHPCFQKFLVDMKINPLPGFTIDKKYAKQGCP